MKAWLVFAIVLLVLVSVSPLASASRTIRWDTTEEFDSGVKSDEQGIKTAETVSDNPAAQTNILSSANVYGDNFRRTDVDGITWRMRNATGCSQVTGKNYIHSNDVLFNYTSPSTGLAVQQVIDAEDGALVFKHEPFGARNSTRMVRNVVTGYGDFVFNFTMASSMWGLANFTVFFSSASSTTGFRLWCGSNYNTSATGQRGFGFFIAKYTSSDVFPALWFIQPFWVGSLGKYNKCGSLHGYGGGTANFRITRQYPFWAVHIDNVLIGACSPSDGFFGPSFLTFGFTTNGTGNQIGGVVSIWNYWVRNIRVGPPYTFGGYFGGPGTSMNWTSPTTGAAQPGERALTLIFRSTIATIWCNPKLLRASDSTVLEFWGICTDTPLKVFTRDVTTTSPGPYKVYIEALPEFSDTGAFIYSVEIILSGTESIPGIQDKFGWIGNVIGLGLCSSIGIMVGITLLLLMRRIKDSGPQ